MAQCPASRSPIAARLPCRKARSWPPAWGAQCPDSRRSRPATPWPRGRPFHSGSMPWSVSFRAHDALFDAFFGMCVEHDALHENAGRVDRVGIECPRFHDFLHLDDRDLAGHRAHRIEVAGSPAINQVAGFIGLPGFDEGDIRGERLFEYVMLVAELTRLLAVGNYGAVTRVREKCRDARAAQ